jgi:DNA polymerase III epsilon subunit-like protein
MKKYIAIDFEFTGDNRPFQIGAITQDGDEFMSIINPEENISHIALEKTKYKFTDELVKQYPTWKEIGRQFFEWVDKISENGVHQIVFIGHNINNGDVGCIIKGFERYPELIKLCPKSLETSMSVCTLTITKKLKLKLNIPNNKQETVYQKLFEKLPNDSHDALDDAKCCMQIATHEIFQPLLEMNTKPIGGTAHKKWKSIFIDYITQNS